MKSKQTMAMPTMMNRKLARVPLPDEFQFSTMSQILSLQKIPGQFAVCKLKHDEPIPLWAISGQIWSVTRTASELSVVCSQTAMPPDIKAERDWRILKVVGPLPFEMIGVLSSLVTPLADAGVSSLALSTFDTDLILVKENSFDAACQVLSQTGHIIS